MRRCNKLLFATAIAATVGTIHYLNCGPSGSLAKLVGVARSLRATSDEADDGGAASRPSRAVSVSPETLAAVAKVKTGTTRAQVEQVLGRCSFAKTETGPDGHAVESAAWLQGEDMICIRFSDGLATLVAAARLAELGEAPSPASEHPADASATANGDKGASQQPEDFQNRLRQLEEKLKGNGYDEELFQRVFDAVTEQE